VIIVRKETYPYPPDIPEGRWAVYEVTLPSRPYNSVTITYRTLTATLGLSPYQMTFEPDVWDVPQELTVLALEDEVNIESPYNSGFNMTLESEDMNFDGQSVPDFEVTVEDNDEGMATSLTIKPTLTHTYIYRSARL
jgi:hypothetical protein